MSERERAVALLELVPESKIGYAVAFLQGLTADEQADDAFCMKLYQDYLNDPEKGEAIPVEEFAAQLGITL